MVGYVFLKRVTDQFNVAAIAAAYGSVSAVTFITAIQFLESHHVAFGGYMAVALVLMESPAIIIAVMLASRLRQSGGAHGHSRGQSITVFRHGTGSDIPVQRAGRDSAVFFAGTKNTGLTLLVSRPHRSLRREADGLHVLLLAKHIKII